MQVVPRLRSEPITYAGWFLRGLPCCMRTACYHFIVLQGLVQGQQQAQPFADGTTMNLERYWSMEEDATQDEGCYGSVLSESEFLAFFGASETRQDSGARAAAEGLAL